MNKYIYVIILMLLTIPSKGQHPTPQVWSLSPITLDTISISTPGAMLLQDQPLKSNGSVLEGIYKKSFFSNMPNQGTITDFYVRLASPVAAGVPIYGYRVMIGYTMLDTIPPSWTNQNPPVIPPNLQVFPGLTQVFYDTFFHFPYNMVKGDWLKVHLTTPFTYSFAPQGETGKIPNLVVHVSQDSMTFFTPSSLAPALYAYQGGQTVRTSPVWDPGVTGQGSLLLIGFDVQPLAGVSDLTSVRGFTLVPNPAATAVAVRFEATEALSQSELTITNIAGMVVKRVPLASVRGSFTKQIDVSGLANGLYFVALRANGQQQVQKLVVQR